MFKKTLLATVAAASLAALAPLTAQAQRVTERVTIVRVAPPEPRHEVVPEHRRRGQVWIPGYYDWRNNQYRWVSGHWERERRGQHWQQARWVERNGVWHRVGGNWARGPGGDRDGDGIANRNDRDRDGDGIRNRLDPNPNQPNTVARRGPNGDLDRDGIRNKNDRDRDGDGVRNRRDSTPNNPNRN